MGKSIVYYLMFLFLACKCYSQGNDISVPNENDSLYIKAIENYLTESKLHQNRYVTPNKIRKTLFIIGEDFLNNIPKTIKDHKLVMLWPSNQYQYFQENNNHLLAISFMPLTLENGKFYIDIKQLELNITKTESSPLRIGMWVTSYFKFNKGRLIYERHEIGGAD